MAITDALKLPWANSARKTIAKGPGGFLEDSIPKLKPAEIPEIDSQYRTLAENQRSQADQFRQNKAGIAAGINQLNQESGLRELAKTQAGINRGYSGRGLLYSGLRQADRGMAGNQMAGQLASKAADLNRTLDEQAQEMDMGAIKSGQTLRDLEQERKNKLYQDALARTQARAQEDSGTNFITRWTKGAFGGVNI